MFHSTVCTDKGGASGTLSADGGVISTDTQEDFTCKWTANGKTVTSTLKMNGCKFVFHPSVPGHGWFDVGPSGCGPAVLKLDSGECEWSMASATNLDATYSNIKGSPVYVEAVANSEKLPTTAKGPKGTCGQEHDPVFLSSNWQLKTSVDLSVDENDPFFVASGFFEAESYPLSVAGEQDPVKKHVVNFNGPVFKCDVAWLGNGEVTGKASELAVDGGYEGCKMTSAGKTYSTAEIETNTCHYVLHGAGTVDIACEEAGDAIEAAAYFGGSIVCRFRVGPQTGLNKVTYGGPEVSVGLELKGITYTTPEAINEAICGKKSGGTAGTYTGSTKLSWDGS